MKCGYCTRAAVTHYHAADEEPVDLCETHLQLWDRAFSTGAITATSLQEEDKIAVIEFLERIRHHGLLRFASDIDTLKDLLGRLRPEGDEHE